MSSPDPTAAHSTQHRPFAAYGAIAVAFNGLFAAGLLAARRRDRLPERFGAGDVALLGAATAKLSRLYCVSQWVAAGLVIGHALAPRETRLVASTFTVFGLADVMNLAYSAAQERA